MVVRPSSGLRVTLTSALPGLEIWQVLQPLTAMAVFS